MTSLSTPGWIREGTTDSNGILSIEDVPYGEISVVETNARGIPRRPDRAHVSRRCTRCLHQPADRAHPRARLPRDAHRVRYRGSEVQDRWRRGVEARIARRGSLLRDRLRHHARGRRIHHDRKRRLRIERGSLVRDRNGCRTGRAARFPTTETKDILARQKSHRPYPMATLGLMIGPSRPSRWRTPRRCTTSSTTAGSNRACRSSNATGRTGPLSPSRASRSRSSTPRTRSSR